MTEEQTEEIRGLIVALSSTNEDTFKYKGSTYARDATTASTAEVPSLKKVAEKKFDQLTSPMVEATYTQNGNELTMNTTIYKTESNVYETVSEAEKQRDAVPEGGFKRNEMVTLVAERKSGQQADNGRGFVWSNYDSAHPRYRELTDKHPCIKEAVLQMQSAIDRTPFKGVIGVGIREYGSTVWVYRTYVSARRFVNRVKAYSERYEELRKHLVPTQFIE
jgi:hypothetical protein